MRETKEFQEKMRRVEALIEKIEASADSELRAVSLEVIQTLMDFHGAGVERMMDLTAKAGMVGYAIFDDFARDEIVAALLLLYGLHPKSIEERVLQAIGKLRPTLSLHGGDVEVLGVTNGVVELRLRGSCDGCPSSTLTLKHTIEEAIYEAAPDVVSIKVEDSVQSGGFVQIRTPKQKVYTECEFVRAAG